MHHAIAARASGFGVYNDPAIAIAWLLEHGAERVAYVDIDAHHGDGVQTAFYADPRVLAISLHQHPATLFPFAGLPAETGGPGAEGTAVNAPGSGCGPPRGSAGAHPGTAQPFRLPPPRSLRA